MKTEILSWVRLKFQNTLNLTNHEGNFSVVQKFPDKMSNSWSMMPADVVRTVYSNRKFKTIC